MSGMIGSVRQVRVSIPGFPVDAELKPRCGTRFLRSDVQVEEVRPSQFGLVEHVGVDGIPESVPYSSEMFPFAKLNFERNLLSSAREPDQTTNKSSMYLL